jgi:hypothetical protein
MSAISKFDQTVLNVSGVEHTRRMNVRTMAEVVVLAAVVRKEVHSVIRRDVLRVVTHELCVADEQCIDTGKDTNIPLTVGQRVSIVRWYSYSEMVNP